MTLDALALRFLALGCPTCFRTSRTRTFCTLLPYSEESRPEIFLRYLTVARGPHLSLVDLLLADHLYYKVIYESSGQQSIFHLAHLWSTLKSAGIQYKCFMLGGLIVVRSSTHLDALKLPLLRCGQHVEISRQS